MTPGWIVVWTKPAPPPAPPTLSEARHGIDQGSIDPGIATARARAAHAQAAGHIGLAAQLISGDEKTVGDGRFAALCRGGGRQGDETFSRGSRAGQVGHRVNPFGLNGDRQVPSVAGLFRKILRRHVDGVGGRGRGAGQQNQRPDGDHPYPDGPHARTATSTDPSTTASGLRGGRRAALRTRCWLFDHRHRADPLSHPMALLAADSPSRRMPSSCEDPSAIFMGISNALYPLQEPIIWCGRRVSRNAFATTSQRLALDDLR